MITQCRLKHSLDYNKDNGIFTWKNPTARNTKYGDIAGSSNNSTGYIYISIDNKKYSAHRLVFVYIYGKCTYENVDHINHIKTDNRLSNLRGVSEKENSKNLPLQKNNTSGVPGVSFNKRQSRWVAYIYSDSSRVHLGTFFEFSDALSARKDAEKIFGYHSHHGKKLKDAA